MKKQLILLTLIMTFIIMTLYAGEQTLADYKTDLNHTLYIKANTVLRQIEKKQTMTLIDVRNKKAFRQFHVPGAIRIPLSFIKTKHFLKNQQIILIHAGIPSGQLERTVMALNQKGFDAKILFGGLNAWIQKKGPIKGDKTAARSTNFITPSMFHQDRWDSHHMIINISAKKKIRGLKNNRHTIHLPLTEKRLDWLKRFKIRTKAHQAKAFRDIWIMGDDIRAYRIVKALLKNKSDIPVFYLKGGLPSYMAYKERVPLTLKPKQDRIKTNQTCPNCNTVQ